MWKYNGSERPPFAAETAPDQESVWDYPRPPIMRTDSRRVSVYFRGLLIAESSSCIRVLETAGAPTFYIPSQDVDTTHLRDSDRQSVCEWKGLAIYCSVIDNDNDEERLRHCGWRYTQPNPAFKEIKNHYSFYPSLLDCFVDNEQARPQPGGFYGGWVTNEITGPIKGERGTEWW